MSNSLVASTPTCVAIGTLSQHDGHTRLRLAAESEEAVGSLGTVVFQGTLEIPGRRIVVASVHGDQYLVMPVDDTAVTLRVWANDPTEPDEILVIVGT